MKRFVATLLFALVFVLGGATLYAQRTSQWPLMKIPSTREKDNSNRCGEHLMVFFVLSPVPMVGLIVQEPHREAPLFVPMSIVHATPTTSETPTAEIKYHGKTLRPGLDTLSGIKEEEIESITLGLKDASMAPCLLQPFE